MILLVMLRNLLRNKRNSLIVTLLIGTITFLFFVGNSVFARSERGLRDTFIDSLTGDVIIQKTQDVTMNLFGSNSPVTRLFYSLPPLPAYDHVMKIVSEEKEVGGITSQVSSQALLDIYNLREPVLLCGVDPASYFSLFPGIILEEGRFLEAGEYGAMITKDQADSIEKSAGTRLGIGTPLLFTSGGLFGFKIRELPLTGIFSYRNPGQLMKNIVITDPQSVRALASIQVASSDPAAEGDDRSLFETGIDDLFEGEFSEDFSLEGGSGDAFSVDALSSFLRDSAGDEGVVVSGGDWNFILLKLKKGVSPPAFISSLNKKIASYGVTAFGWRIGAGNSAILLLMIHAFFNIGIFLISIAGIIAAVNILLISVFKRTREIGTLRAIGASDGYIRLLVLGENVVLSCLGGLLGVFGGAWMLMMINRMKITISNRLLASLLGGTVLSVEFLPSVMVAAFGIAMVLGIISSLFSVEKAVHIEPVVAVSQG
jgi:ABC-type lipoprotein release transport system permease subunit